MLADRGWLAQWNLPTAVEGNCFQAMSSGNRGLGRTKLLRSMGVKEGRGSSKAGGQILFPCSSWEITSELLGRIRS